MQNCVTFGAYQLSVGGAGIIMRIPHVSSHRNCRICVFCFRGKDTEFQFCLKQKIFTVRTENGPSSAGFTGKSGIFWQPPRHNKLRDRHERSDSCYLVPYLSFKQITSLFNVAFSRNIASKLRFFHCICRVKVCASLRLQPEKTKYP
jgi:hypothetical protein